MGYKKSRIAPLKCDLRPPSRTSVWNLLIGVLAQPGHDRPNAISLQNDFIVEGERHYWVHLAIDRLTRAGDQ
jgi:hypothetical protein